MEASIRMRFLRRSDGRVGYALMANMDYTIIADFARRGCASPFRRVYMALYCGAPIEGIPISMDLHGLMAEIVKHSERVCAA